MPGTFSRCGTGVSLTRFLLLRTAAVKAMGAGLLLPGPYGVINGIASVGIAGPFIVLHGSALRLYTASIRVLTLGNSGLLRRRLLGSRLGGTASWSTREQLPAESLSPLTTPPPCRLPLVCRGLWQGAQSRISTDFRHVAGHQGFTVNEIADFLAGYATRYPAAGSTAYSQFPSDFAPRLHTACGTLWLLPTATQTAHGLVWACPDTSSTSAPEPAFEDMTLKGPDLSAATASAPPPLPATSCLAKVVQANIQTIKDTDPSFFNREGHGQRRIYLARQLLTNVEAEQGAGLPMGSLAGALAMLKARRDGPLVIGVDANADFLAQAVLRMTFSFSLFRRLACVLSVSRHRQFPEFDILNGDARDHMPLCCQVQIPGRACQDPRPSGRYAVDRASDVATAVWFSVTPRFDLSPSAQVSTFMRQHAAAVKALPRRPPFVKRQPYLSDEAAVILSDLRDARAELRTLQAALASSTLRAAFARWCDCTRPVDPEAQHHCLRLQIAHYQSVAFSLRVRAHSLARRDKKQYFESLLTDAAAHWHATGRVQESANKLAWASKTARQKREVRAASGFDIDADLQAQFQQQEAGRIVTTEQLAAHFSAWQQHHRDACPLALPTLLDLEAMCRSQKRGKAPGPDQVRNEVWKCQPDQASRWLWPLCLRVSGGHPEPMHFKDSAVCALHKKGPAHLPVNFRSIAMLNGVAKLWHSHVRATVGQEILHRYFPTQLGGRKGVDTGLALAVFRCASDLADTAGRSWAAFFVDIQAAYYETDRDLLFHDASNDAALLQLQLPAHVHKLIAGGVLQGLGVPQSQIDLLRDCVECSFWTFTGQTQAVMASRGSRPGDGLADVLFGALFAVILNCLDHACQSEGICHTSLYEALGEAPRPLQIAWADDLSLLADFDSPQEAVELLPRFATVILRTIEAFRFRVNLAPGKTEALVKICGNGATAARARLLSDTAGIPTADGRYVRLVPEYKYLGVPQRSNDSGRRDIEAAAGRGRAVWSQAANLVHSPSLPWPLKLAWFTGRTLPAAFSSLGTTVAVSARALSPLKGFYDQCLRQLATAWTDGHHVSSETLQICISAPDVDVSICVARVRLLCRLVQRRSDSAYAALVAAWDRAGRWAVLLQQADDDGAEDHDGSYGDFDDVGEWMRRFSFNDADWRHVTELAKDLIRGLLRMSEVERITAKQALFDTWIVQTAPVLRAPLKQKYFENMRKYCSFNKFKQASLQIIVSQLEPEILKPLTDTFMWLDSSGEGHIDADEIEAGMKRAGWTEVEMPEDLHDMVSGLDADGSGEIGLGEFVASVLDLQVYAREEVCWAVFRIYDQDGDGQIGVTDLMDILNNGQPDGQEVVSAHECRDLLKE
ncbi:CPK3, partial [Symbiodinium sp. KB8]